MREKSIIHNGYKIFTTPETGKWFIMDGKNYYGGNRKASGFNTVSEAKAFADSMKKGTCSAVESDSSNKENYLREMAKVDYEVGHTQDPDDFSLFRRICLEDGYRVTKADFNRYFEILDEIRAEGFEENEDEYGDDEERYGFEAMSRTGLEGLTSALSKALKEVGSVVVIQRILQEDFGYDFEDQITFIKNTTDLSDSKMVLDEIVSAAETMLDDVQLELLTEVFNSDMIDIEGFEEEPEFDEYEEPDDWSSVDEPISEEGEEPTDFDEEEPEEEVFDEEEEV